MVTVQNLDEAIKFVNSRPKPLAAYLFTKTKNIRERVIKEVPAGGMLINHLVFQFATTKLPFGGVGPSGTGCLPRQVGLRGVQPQEVGADQADPTRPVQLHLPPVYREGVEAGAQAVVARHA